MFRVLEALPAQFVVGDSGVQPQCIAESDVDPGPVGTAVLQLWPVVGDEPAEVPAEAEIVAFGSVWRLTLTGAIEAEDAETVPQGLYFGRFVVTFDSGQVVTLPADDRLQVTVYGAAVEAGP